MPQKYIQRLAKHTKPQKNLKKILIKEKATKKHSGKKKSNTTKKQDV